MAPRQEWSPLPELSWATQFTRPGSVPTGGKMERAARFKLASPGWKPSAKSTQLRPRNGAGKEDRTLRGLRVKQVPTPVSIPSEMVAEGRVEQPEAGV